MKNLLFFVLLTPSLCRGQVLHGGLEFSRTEFNYPKTENWLSRIDTIEVTNHTGKKEFLLKQKYPREFDVRIPAAGIEPGKTAVVEIVYKPSKTGPFNSSIQLWHSASVEPLIITYKGEVLSFDEFSDVACPSFSKPSLKPVDFELEVTVVDSATGIPLPHSLLEITKGEYYTNHKTDDSGKFIQRTTINYFVILAEHQGHTSRYVSKHINPKNRKVTILLPSASISSPVTPQSSLPSQTIVVAETIPAATTIHTSTPPSTAFPLTEYKKNNIVFLIDKSSSMNKPDCMPWLQTAMTELAKMMRAEDRVTIITYANEARVVLPGTPGNEHNKMISVIEQLRCGGRTEGGKAIHTAYKNAEENFIKEGVNQVIVATDGGFNGISENESELMALVGEKAKQEIKLSVLAFGQNRYGKAHIQRLAKQGEGTYVFIGSAEDAKNKLTGTIMEQSKMK